MRTALLAATLALPGCSLLGLFDDPVVIEPCTNDQQCRTGPYANDECVDLKCNTEKATCEAYLRDLDHDGHAWDACQGYPREFIGTPDDCVDEDPGENRHAPAIYAGAPELCDLVDNDCDGDTDEEPDASEACAPFECIPGVGCAGRQFVALAAGCNHTCAMRANGAMVCWGANDDDELGVPASRDLRYLPVEVETPPVRDAVAIAAGAAHTCAVHETGTVDCWGSNDQSRAGGGALSGLSADTEIVAGYAHTCVLDGGVAQCWGWNEYGQLGDGTDGGQRPDARPVALSDVLAIAAGAGTVDESGIHTCAIYGDTRQASCWGWNRYGQIGQPVGEGTATPTDVPGQTDVISIAAGPYMTCAAHATGAECWGWDGQDGKDPFLPPLAILDVPNPTKVSVGLYHACAIADGAWCWGLDDVGQLGNDREPVANRTTPYAVFSPPDLVDVACGCSHSCGIDTDGHVWCWGDNTFGQLGDGTQAQRVRPVQITDPTE